MKVLLSLFLSVPALAGAKYGWNPKMKCEEALNVALKSAGFGNDLNSIPDERKNVYPNFGETLNSYYAAQLKISRIKERVADEKTYQLDDRQHLLHVRYQEARQSLMQLNQLLSKTRLDFPYMKETIRNLQAQQKKLQTESESRQAEYIASFKVKSQLPDMKEDLRKALEDNMQPIFAAKRMAERAQLNESQLLGLEVIEIKKAGKAGQETDKALALQSHELQQLSKKRSGLLGLLRSLGEGGFPTNEVETELKKVDAKISEMPKASDLEKVEALLRASRQTLTVIRSKGQLIGFSRQNQSGAEEESLICDFNGKITLANVLNQEGWPVGTCDTGDSVCEENRSRYFHKVPIGTATPADSTK